ncbi:MAG TPA: hypothetical protein V6C52_15195 [Coleofasciculaceae cyanobacterium]|jgi:hypothetical protein
MNISGFPNALQFGGRTLFEHQSSQDVNELLSKPENEGSTGIYRSRIKKLREDMCGKLALLDNVGLRHQAVYKADVKAIKAGTYPNKIHPEDRFLAASDDELDQYVQTRQAELPPAEEAVVPAKKSVHAR